MRAVVDTNVLVSAILLPRSTPRRAVNKVLTQGNLLLSEATMAELAETLFRPKFDRYVSRSDRELFLSQLGSTVEFVPIIQLIRECRDPKDDKFLEVALNGRADVIVTGDPDLFAMNPWRKVAIMSPANYLTY